ncbi:response regulator [Maritalea porphyrae]|uniref:response regulator n=1 Tax=Maritalea porphyrae TaxID=880732 RepID=UPI0022AF2514|nr:response regulator [Maritalea porphyrae]MCZ4273493.1 response regulator [Maritalea porphyrae]
MNYFGIDILAPKGLHARLLLAFAGISLIPLLIVSATFFYVLIRNVEGENFAKLEFVNEAKRSEIRQYIQFASRQADSLSQTNIVRYSIGEFYGFSYGFREISTEPEEAARILRGAFGIGAGENAISRDDLISSALIYDNMHTQFHGEYEAFLASSEYDNLYLVNNGGRIVYSVEKDNYLATSISGAVSNSPLAKVAHEVLNGETDQGIVFGDFEHDPVTGEFVAYVAVKVRFYSRPSGAVIFRLQTDGIERIVQSETREAGQIYLLSSRRQVLSQPLDGIYAIGERPAIDRATLPNSGTAKIDRGLSSSAALAAFGDVPVFDANWLLVSEVPSAQAYSTANTLIGTVTTIALLAIPILFLIAARLARSATNPILRITNTAEAIAAGDLNRSMPRIEKPIELKRLADSFGRMRDAVREQLSQINANVEAIGEKNAQLEEADRMKDTFLANTSHELRTPLNGIVGISETLSAGVAGDLSERQRSQLQLITFSARKLSRLVDDLLDLYRIRQGRMRLDMHPVDVATSVRNVLQLSEPLLQGEPVTLRVDIEKDTPLVMADPVRLEQILHNLVGNAIKYTEAGSIRIFAEAKDDWVDISIVDTGVGISQEDLGRMFQPLEQADDGVDTARKTGGTGLGLTIARQLATILGGRLTATSALGEGSNFSLRLRSATQQDFEHEGVPVVAGLEDGYHETLNSLDNLALTYEAPKKKGAPDILVVDDEPINLQVLRNVLLPQGFGVRTADSGKAALEMIEAAQPQLIILDVMMPDLSGLEVARRLRERFDRLELPIIMVTARSRTRDIIAGLEAGANDYVVKPFVKDELLARISTLLEAQKARQATAENAKLHNEMQRRIQVEDALRLSQNRMAGLLDTLNVGLWCVDESGRLTYANRFALNWIGTDVEGVDISSRMPAGFFHSLLEDCNANGQAEPRTLSMAGVGEVTVFAFEMDQEAGGGLSLVLVPEQSNETGSKTADIAALQKALETIEVPMASVPPRLSMVSAVDDQPDRVHYRKTTVRLMKSVLCVWQDHTKSNKFEFAEKSGIWRVHLDRSSLQTRTLDKYFSVETLPTHPRWRDVVASAEYVLEHCADYEDQAELDKLNDLRQEFVQLVRDGAAKWGDKS